MKVFSLLALCFVIIQFSCAQKALPPEATEVWEPVPRVVTPGQNSAAPSDAIVLFDGKDFSEWEHLDGKAVAWNIEKNAMVVKPKSGNIQTKKEFGDMQLHIEFRTPAKVDGEGQGRGNSGVFLQKRYEVQVLDNYNNKTYPNGQAGALYKQTMPLVNACRPPGTWQQYDIIYRAPRFNEDGMKIASAYVTVIHNGVLIQNHTEIKGTTEYIGLPKNIAHGKAPIMLQDHDNLTAFRNVWVREL
ncbi:MAG: DUF1080 domain-containing protein [Bacteroidota bacterium]